MSDCMIRTLIIDDEAHAIERLTQLLAHHCGDDIRILGHAQQFEEGFNAIQSTQPDLIFLDIEIGENTGFELLRRFDQPSFSVIFTTAYERYALQAIKFSALDYLLKPIDPEDLIVAVEKRKNLYEAKQHHAQLELLFNNLSLFKQGLSKIMVPSLQGFELLNITEITRCQSDVNYTTIFLVNGKNIMVAKTIKEFEHLLSPHHFYRIHQSHLVNLQYVLRYHKGKGGTVILQDGHELPVATRRKDGFLQKIQSVIYRSKRNG
ncbi:response regulator transcription factor [Olivibacter sp. SDN3]|uniref:LytR/AlgR family response regulator transcription factor n=1 Tax=Olivibacter sp. SDN3 TaxID=2764720 RepID=UPI0016516391|nr:LytTR family DNA-binding domain-containing protein [Olivibacter sp. SDN3]QNL51744.1 response regulator transcription factor [Olivibacter sp. SDN3]